ncbi:hypothetical protein K435DRAFT_966396 [Dendrothele bispora CBS 962.96]|uniref:Uncharacterized protein n=1 Tax=Dendrothele bispora (strain CBS 962.96) TaxID=1314807 RepID=A0A4S8M0V3_DENBC|nr:hypothetical protein K435DRAFT_966396 [Dendrothele bispora CBS 962.96]
MHFQTSVIISLFACTILSSSVSASPIEPVLTPVIAAKNNMGGTDTLGQNTTTNAEANTNAGTPMANAQQLLLAIPVVAGLSSLVL